MNHTNRDVDDLELEHELEIRSSTTDRDLEQDLPAGGRRSGVS